MYFIKIIIVFVFFHLALHFNSIAQYPCGTQISKEQLDTLKQFNQQTISYKMNADTEIYYVPLKLHIIRKSDGSGGSHIADVYRAVDSANYFFKNANIQFILCDTINYINNDRYLSFEAKKEEDLISQNDVARSINIYFTDSVSIENKLICGYSYLPTGPLRVFITNFCINNGSTLTHELGHVFSLIHTHGSSNDNLTDELVNGSNCSIAGDFICETPADPNLSGKVNIQCQYLKKEKDANGDTFKPLTNNIMSYSHANCMDSFTPQQYQRMYSSLFQHKRINLICSLHGDVENKIEVVYPNPCFTEIYIKYQLEEDATVSLGLYNILGEKVENIYEGEQKKGLAKAYHRFNTVNLSSRLYFIMLVVDGKITDARKIIKWE